MSRSYEHIEGLLSQRGDTGTLSEGFSERVTQGIAGEAPGALPVSAPVMPAAVKGVIGLGVAGAASAMIWFAVSAGPSGPSAPLADNNNGGITAPVPDEAVAVQGDSAIDLLKAMGEMMAKAPGDKPDLFTETRQMLAGAAKVGSAFVSIFPREWTDLLWKPQAAPTAPGTTTPAGPTTPAGSLNG
ncbi:MAG: hypothetical protein ACI89L_001628 [Phycisphaerales bacterium]|jgi:hypothetical protein